VKLTIYKKTKEILQRKKRTWIKLYDYDI